MARGDELTLTVSILEFAKIKNIEIGWREMNVGRGGEEKNIIQAKERNNL